MVRLLACSLLKAETYKTHYPVVSENASSAGMNYIRVPIGASDFSTKGASFLFVVFSSPCSCHFTWSLAYTLDDTPNDTSLQSFGTTNVPSDVFDVLQDIKNINGNVKIHLCPWSPVRVQKHVLYKVQTDELETIAAGVDEGQQQHRWRKLSERFCSHECVYVFRL